MGVAGDGGAAGTTDSATSPCGAGSVETATPAEAGCAAHTQEGRWVLAWSLESATLHDLYEALHLPLAGRWTEQVSAPWQRLVLPAMDRIVRAESAAMQVTLASLIADTLEPGPPRRRHGGWRSAAPIAEPVASQ